MEQRIEDMLSSSDYYVPKCVNIFPLQVEHYIGFPLVSASMILSLGCEQEFSSWPLMKKGHWLHYLHQLKEKKAPCVEMVPSVVFKSGVCVCLVYT